MTAPGSPGAPAGTPVPVAAPTPAPAAAAAPIPPAPAPTWPPDDRAALGAFLAAIEARRGNPSIVYWTTAMARISLVAELPLFDQLQAIGKVPAIDLVLFTHGGDAEVPWRLVSLIREYCDVLNVLIPHRALSAGTMLALGANEIIATPLTALGPIDPTRTHHLLPRSHAAAEAEPISVQDMRHAMQFIQSAVPNAGKTTYTPEAMAQIFTALFDKIHPLAIGAIEQSYALAKLIGKRCLESHLDPKKNAAKIKKIVNRLCDDYKSHSYQIGRKEAREVGLNVTDADPALEALLLGLLGFYMARQVGPHPAGAAAGAAVKLQLAWMDSPRRKFRVIGDAIVQPDGSLKNVGDQWLPY